MKFDKDTLLKQRFWLLLAVSVPLAVVGLFLLSSSVPALIGKERKAIDAALKEMADFSRGDPKSPEWVKVAAKKAAEKKKQEEIVWKNAAGEQSDLMTWPASVEEKYHFRDGKFAKEITATRKKEDKKADPGPAPPNDASHFHGTITEVNQDGIVVGKEVFVRTTDVKVQITADPEEKNPTFSSLQPGDRVTIKYEKGKFFGDRLTENERTEYARTYKDQLRAILEQVIPVNEKGEGVVQFPGWVYNGKDLPPKGAQPFFRYVADDWKQEQDFSDEAWMAQEDLWVEQEIYRLVRVANDSVAQFKGKGGSEKDKDYEFANPYWHLKCRVTGDGNLKVTIKNLQEQRQFLDVTFLIKLFPARKAVPIKIEGMARAPAGMDGDTLEVSIDKDKWGGQKAQGVLGVEQVLTWKTAAVKRIDYISIGSTALDDSAESHRQCTLVLKPLRPDQQKEQAAPDPKVPVPGGIPRGKRRFDPAAAGALTPNGLIAERYLDVTDQARRIPVGVVLIVDQEHVERVQAAFANSKLRFLTTQVVLNRYPGSIRPPETADKTATPPGGGLNRPAPPLIGGLGPGGAGGRYGGRLAGFPGGPTFGGAALGAGDEQESNVELVLYGIVSLYQRYPPRARAP